LRCQKRFWIHGIVFYYFRPEESSELEDVVELVSVEFVVEFVVVELVLSDDMVEFASEVVVEFEETTSK